MKIYSKQTVYEAALDRIRFIFDEFPNVIVGVSGGKDSTVVFQLALIVAREKNRLPLKTMFLDQEAEWQATIDQIKYHMYHPDVEPLWFQMPMRIFNATSAYENWLKCWDPEQEANWVHPRDPISITENVYGTDRFHNIFEAILRGRYQDTKTCYVSGVRTEESPNRFMALTEQPKYKWVTWGSRIDRKTTNRGIHFTFYPIYDWNFGDVWKAIYDNDWLYNKLYDYQYQYGVGLRNMRVSNVHHETAIRNLFYLQEVEPDTWERLANRISGVDMATKFGEDYEVKELPFMFDSWREYRDYLLENLITNEDWKIRFKKKFDRHDIELGDAFEIPMCRAHVNAILCNDWEGVKLDNWLKIPKHLDVRRKRRIERRQQYIDN